MVSALLRMYQLPSASGKDHGRIKGLKDQGNEEQSANIQCVSRNQRMVGAWGHSRWRTLPWRSGNSVYWFPFDLLEYDES